MFGMAKTDDVDYFDSVYATFNNDNGANYRAQYLTASSTGISASQETAQNGLVITTTTGTLSSSGSLGSFFSVIPHYKSNNWKSLIRLTGTGQSSATNLFVSFGFSFWESTAPVRSINLSAYSGANIAAGSIISVYGVK